MRLEQRLQELRQTWPSLQWKDARLLEEDHDVVILDESLVFRFPCSNPDHEPLEREVQFLERLRRRASLPVPEYTYVDKEYRVVGYPMIQGEQLDWMSWDSVTQTQQREIAIGVAQVLNEVHGFPIEEAEKLGIQHDDSWPEEARALLFYYIWILRQGSLVEEEMKCCDGIARSILDSDLDEHIEERVIHGDLDPAHILQKGGRFAGVFDFGDVMIGDPACEFGRLWELGEEFVDDVLAHYDHGTENLKQRGYMFWFGNSIREMEWGARSGCLRNWQRGYRFFPEGVASPDRMMGLQNDDWKTDASS